MSIPIALLNDTLGAAFLGNIVVAILYGVTSVQTYLYYRRNRDSYVLKGLVFVLWLLDGLHLALITHALYVYSVIDFANYAALLRLEWSIAAHIAVCATSDAIVRSIFAYRIWKLSRSSLKWVITVVIAVLSLLYLGGALFLTAACFVGDSFGALTRYSWSVYLSFVAAIITDFIIASSMCVLLVKRRTGLKRTNSIVHRLMLYSINTCAFTTLCEIAVSITYAVWPTNFIYLAIYFILPKLLLNALLASLNAREELRKQLDGDILSIPLSPRNVAHNGSDSGRDTIGANPDSGKQMNSYGFQL